MAENAASTMEGAPAGRQVLENPHVSGGAARARDGAKWKRAKTLTVSGGAALGSTTGYFSAGQSVQASDPLASVRRAYRLRQGLRFLWDPSGTERRLALCGYGSPAEVAVVFQRYASGRVSSHWHGAFRCDRQGCPHCTGLKQGKYRSRIERAVRGWTEKGPRHRAQHVTLTIPHHHDSLTERTNHLLECMGRFLSRRKVRDVLERAGYGGSARALEVTWGWRNGWHPHFEALWLLERGVQPWERVTLAEEWARVSGASVEHGLRFGRSYIGGESAEAGLYLTKISSELAGHGKAAHPEHFTLTELWERASSREAMSVARVQEYARAMRGRRVLQLDKRAAKLADETPPLDCVVERSETVVYREEYAGLARVSRGDAEVLALPLEVATTHADEEQRHEDVRATIQALLVDHEIRRSNDVCRSGAGKGGNDERGGEAVREGPTADGTGCGYPKGGRGSSGGRGTGGDSPGRGGCSGMARYDGR